MPRPVIPRAMRQLLIEERIKIYAFFGMKRADEGPYFFSGVTPADEDTPIFSDGLIYATATGDTPEEAVEAFRAKIWGGL